MAGGTISSGSMEITLHPASRLAVVRFAGDTSLTGEHAVAMVEAMKSVMGADGERFAMLADAKGVSATDADYRAKTGDFFKQHRATARIALINLGPFIRVVAEMFRVGIGLQMRTFSDEAGARAWLRAEGIVE